MASLTRTGSFRWRFKGPRTDDFRGFVVAGVPVAVPVTGPQRHAVEGLDPRTGRVRRTIGVDVRARRTAWTYRGITGPWLTWRRYAATNVMSEPGVKQCTVVLDGRTGRQLLKVPGVPQNFVPGRRPGLMTRIDSGKRYAARYGYVTLPAG